MKLYCWFITNLFQIRLRQSQPDNFQEVHFYSDLGDTSKNVDYIIITLNYDMVVENIVEFLNSYFKSDFTL